MADPDIPGWMAEVFGASQPPSYAIGPRNVIPDFATTVRPIPRAGPAKGALKRVQPRARPIPAPAPRPMPANAPIRTMPRSVRTIPIGPPMAPSAPPIAPPVPPLPPPAAPMTPEMPSTAPQQSPNIFPNLERQDREIPSTPSYPPESFQHYDIFRPYANKIALRSHPEHVVPSMDATEGGRLPRPPGVIESILNYLNSIRDANIERRMQRQGYSTGGQF